MSWRGIVSTNTTPSVGKPNLLTFNALYLIFLVFLKRVVRAILSLFQPKLQFYQDARIVSQNVLPKHAPLGLYSSVLEALGCGLEEGKAAKRSARTISLNSDERNAKWKFQLFPDPKSVPNELLSITQETEESFENWGETVSVPMDWQMHSLSSKDEDVPIYTNIIFPFPGRWTKLSTYVADFDNPTAVYRALFTLPERFNSNNTEEDVGEDAYDAILVLHGAGAGVEVFVNGRRLGYHTDSMVEHEYHIPQDLLLPQQQNLLCLRIFKYCSGSYYEDQDQWWLTGIHRDVEIQLRPRAACIWDMDVRASLQTGKVEITCEVSMDKQTANFNEDSKRIAVRATIFESATAPLETVVLPCNVIARTMVENNNEFEQMYLDATRQRAISSGTLFVLPKERIEPWTAETPRLYSLILELICLGTDDDEKETVYQVEIVRVGFRDVKLNADKFGQVEVNNQRVVFRGVNRHEFSPHRGKVISEESMVADILQMKRHNFNAVRNSHYPNNRRWYDLCDYYGLYVIDEANIETHGFLLAGAVSLLQFDPDFRDGFLARCQALVLRSRNHPSIVCWSLGNESGYGPNMYDCSRLVRSLDNQRMVTYEAGKKSGVPLLLGDGRHPVSDLIYPMYHSPYQIASYERESRERNAPVVLCEYGHCMGNSGGNLHLYWDVFWKENGHCQGGFIWDWVDQGIAFIPQHPPRPSASPSHNVGTSSTNNLLPHATMTNNSSNALRHDSVSSFVKQRRASSISMSAPHRDNELCVSHERLLDISFQGRGWGYGGDFGPTSGVQDAQFCCNGVVFPDRSPKPAILELKYLMQPFQFILEDVNESTLQVSIKTRYTPGVELEFGWILVGEAEQFGKKTEIISGTFHFDTTSSSFVEISLLDFASSPLLDISYRPYFFRIFARISASSHCKWAEPGHEIAYEVFELVKTKSGAFGRALPPDPAHILPKSVNSMMANPTATTIPEISVVDGTHQLVIHSTQYDARIDMRSGALVSFRGKNDSIERLSGPSFLPSFYRACLDNDIGGAEFHIKGFMTWFIPSGLTSYQYRWKKNGLLDYDENYKWKQLEVVKKAPNQVVVTRSDSTFRVDTTFTFLDSGVSVAVKVAWLKGRIRHLISIPRIGTSLEIGSHFSKITYCGRGPHENYADRKKSSPMGIYTQSADEFHVPYVFPSENGARTDVRWVTMEDSSSSSAGLGLSYSCEDAPEWTVADDSILGDGPRYKRPIGTRGAQLNVSRFRVSQLEKARHQYDLAKDLTEWRAQSLKVHLDTAHMGVGGDVSWNPAVHDPFKVDYFNDRTNTGHVWTYQIDLSILSRFNGDDEEQQMIQSTQSNNNVRGSRENNI